MPPAAPVTTQTLPLTFIVLPSLCAIERLGALDGDAIAQPLVREVVPHGMMHGGAVVPEGDRVGTPGEAAVQLRRLAVAVEHPEQRIALAAAQPDDVRGEVAVHIERLASRHGMGAHHGMLIARKAAFLGLITEAATIDLRAVMYRCQPLTQKLD